MAAIQYPVTADAGIQVIFLGLDTKLGIGFLFSGFADLSCMGLPICFGRDWLFCDRVNWRGAFLIW